MLSILWVKKIEGSVNNASKEASSWKKPLCFEYSKFKNINFS